MSKGTLCPAALCCAVACCGMLGVVATPGAACRTRPLAAWQQTHAVPAHPAAHARPAADPVPLSALKAKKDGELAGLSLFDKGSNLLSLHALSQGHFDYILDEM